MSHTAFQTQTRYVTFYISTRRDTIWALFAEGPGRYTLALVGHHLVIDGASSDEFFSLVSQYYGQQR
ncbi:hypothetical protein, partial [Serratia sp. ME43]|uniref:hypothetical protein n=1 Tax=Serratia sp. ME43 TaxID=2744256 RepID=UPI0015F5442B